MQAQFIYKEDRETTASVRSSLLKATPLSNFETGM
jgi:hypothetical protein